MKYTLKLSKEFSAIQGLRSPIRDAKQLPSLQPQTGYEIVLIVGVEFDESQLGDRGWFVDTDSLESALDAVSVQLSGTKWTELFDFRPTFELVSRWIYQQLETTIPQLSYVELQNETLDITVKYKQEK